MSDEAERVRATLRVLDVLEFNGVPAAVVTADAVKALETLESQNQALQEEVERLKAREMPTLQRKGVATASGTTSDNAALQERAENAEAELWKYQPAQGEGWPDDRHEFAGRLTALREVAEALQERAEKAEAEVERLRRELRQIASSRYRSYTGGGGDGIDVPTREARIAIAALSTQETDPKDNARCPSCRCAEGDGSPCPDIDCPDRWHAQET